MNQRIKILLIVLIFISLPPCLTSQIITKENIKNAGRVIGLDFTDAEIDSMQSSLDSQLSNYDNIRNVELKNNVPPAILFNPIPVGFQFPKEQKQIQFSDYSGTKLPVDINEIAFYSIGQLAELIRTKQITSTGLDKIFS